ncbi:Transcription initiation factor TFIID subunit like protein [Argiope bruennichi]|uniref:Transcription initiation factor TFIID subunit 12 n=1 Tax=Argiope bruennichi TaxID=94029 RepID=A0A8T0FQG7_ARGBR|nr:Transcription initiation factor TFIID subunit like protein [Argiope bruennichi]
MESPKPSGDEFTVSSINPNSSATCIQQPTMPIVTVSSTIIQQATLPGVSVSVIPATGMQVTMPGVSTSSSGIQQIAIPGVSTSSSGIQQIAIPGVSTSSSGIQQIAIPGVSTSTGIQQIAIPGVSTSTGIQQIAIPGVSVSTTDMQQSAISGISVPTSGLQQAIISGVPTSSSNMQQVSTAGLSLAATCGQQASLTAIPVTTTNIQKTILSEINNQVPPKEILSAKPSLLSISGTVPVIETSHNSASAGLNVNMLPPDNTQVHQVLSKQRLQDLIREVDSNVQTDDETDELLLQLADEFIEDVISTSCSLAKHRKSSILEVKDVQFALEKDWNMWIPGFGCEEPRPYKKAFTTEAHKQRMALIRKALRK